MERLWFKRRRFGWGWTPASREGWLVLLIFVVVVTGTGVLIGLTADDGDVWPVIGYLAFVTGAAATLIRVAANHGPSPRWRWGRKPEDDPAEDY